MVSYQKKSIPVSNIIRTYIVCSTISGVHPCYYFAWIFSPLKHLLLTSGSSSPSITIVAIKFSNYSPFLKLCWSFVQASSEYDELPVRHNEDGLNRNLSAKLPLLVEPPGSFESPHTKTHLLLQAHFSHAELPIADYATDTKSVLDQALRILQVPIPHTHPSAVFYKGQHFGASFLFSPGSQRLYFYYSGTTCMYVVMLQAMIDIAADEGWLAPTLRIMHLVQMCVQGRWISDPSILTLPHFNSSRFTVLKQALQKSFRKLILKEIFSLSELLMLYQQDEKLVRSAVTRAVEHHQNTKDVRAVFCTRSYSALPDNMLK